MPQKKETLGEIYRRSTQEKYGIEVSAESTQKLAEFMSMGVQKIRKIYLEENREQHKRLIEKDLF